MGGEVHHGRIMWGWGVEYVGVGVLVLLRAWMYGETHEQVQIQMPDHY